jgi:type IX secretion system PorP/SprF family membrane protein
MKTSITHIILVLLLLIAAITPTSLYAQDIHFSQFYQAPARLNPALTGQFKGGYRIAGIYRSQWSSVTAPYTTFSLSGDAHNFMKQKGLGVGLDFFYDKAGDGNLGTVNFNLSGSYSIAIGSKRNHHLTFGSQVGWAKRQIDPNQLVFDNQYGGGGSLEAFETGSSYFDLNAGILWETKFSNRKKIQLGFATHHLTKPNINFYNSDPTTLNLRISIHGNYQFKVSDKIDLIPGFLAMFQGPHQQITPGINAKYIMDARSNNYRALYFGVWSRINDAGFAVIGMDWNNVNVGVSYDFNYSSLHTASRYRGGFEISLIYIFSEALPPRKHFKTCPDYI